MNCPICGSPCTSTPIPETLHCDTCGWIGHEGDTVEGFDTKTILCAHRLTGSSTAKRRMAEEIYKGILQEVARSGCKLDTKRCMPILLGISAGITMGEGFAHVRLAKAESGQCKLTDVELEQIEIAASIFKDNQGPAGQAT